MRLSEKKIIELFDKNIENYCVSTKYVEDIKKALLDYHDIKLNENYDAKGSMN
jgi:hypothetical protein